MNEELRNEILTKAWGMFLHCSAMKLLSLILDYSVTGEIKYIHKAISFVSSSLVGYNLTLSEGNVNRKKLIIKLVESGVDDNLVLSLRLFIDGERSCSLWALEDFIEERNTGSGMDRIIDAR